MNWQLPGKTRAFGARKTRSLRCLLSLSPMAFGLALFGAIPTHALAQEVGKDVKPDHWAYQAIQDLASKGLIKGYPPDNKFLGGRQLTRYEMATIIQRVLAKMDDIVKNIGTPQDNKAEVDALKTGVGEIRELVNGFKTELTVIGTDMSQVKQDLDTLRSKFGELETKVGDLDARVGTLTKKVDDANIVADQALENITELKNVVNAGLAKKVDVGTGKLKIGGLLQNWYGIAFGDSLGGSKTATGAGRAFGGGVGDTFRVRRGELSFLGSINPKVDYRVMFDVAKTSNGTNAGSLLQDIWIGYQLTPRLRFEIGQQKTPLGEEGTRSSSQLLTVERSIMNDLPRTVGRVGDIREHGALLRYGSGGLNISAGFWDDNGVVQNTVDNDRQKFFTYNVAYNGIRHLTLGISGGTNVGDTRPAAARNRMVGTAIWQSGPHFLETEVAYARDLGDGTLAPVSNGALGTGTAARGGYVLYAHQVSPQWQFVGRYDIWDPAYQAGQPAGSVATTTTGVKIARDNHKLREYTLGFNYYLAKHNAKIQLNYIRVDTEQNGVGFFGKQRTLVLMNYQIAF